MKKTYIKPEIMFENFALTTSIAGNCETKTWTPNSGTCAYPMDIGFGEMRNVFTDTVDACTTKGAEGQYNSICYHTFEANSLFNS